MDTAALFDFGAALARRQAADALMLDPTERAFPEAVRLANEFRRSLLQTANPHRRQQLLERVQACLTTLAEAEEDILASIEDAQKGVA